MNDEQIAAARRQIGAMGPTGWGRAPLADADIDALLSAAPPAAYAAGEVLVREGEPADHAFLLLSGRLRASLLLGGAGPERERTINEIPAGEVAGETALFLTGGRRTATLTALEPSTVLVLRRELFIPPGTLKGLPPPPAKSSGGQSPPALDAINLSAANPALVALESHILTGLARRIERTDAQIVAAWRSSSGGGPSLAGLMALLGGSS
jgi:CRP-like cAMP-binding protein